MLEDNEPKMHGIDALAWNLGEDGEFTVKRLKESIDDKVLGDSGGLVETKWNKLIPRKVNIFVWRLCQSRILVRVELDRKCLDPDSLLCPCFEVVIETVNHCLVGCEWVQDGSEKVFRW